MGLFYFTFEQSAIMKQWTEQNFFNKGQQEDIDPTLSDGQSFVSLKNGRLIQNGAEDYSVQNVIGDEEVTEGGFGFTGTSDIYELRFTELIDYTSTVTGSIQIIDPEDSDVIIPISINAPGDSLNAYKELSNALNTALQALTSSTNLKFYKTAYDSQRLVLWVDKGAIQNDINAIDFEVNILSGNISKKLDIGKCNNFKPIAYKEFQKEVIVIAVGLNGNAVYDESADLEEGSADFIQNQFSVPISPNLTAIWGITINDDGSFATSRLLYCNYLNNKLNIITDIEGSEENQDIVRIYMTDGLNPKRFFNLRDTNLMVLKPKETEVFPEIKFSQPILRRVSTNGQLPVGIYQYCYTLVTQNGAETVISPVSQMIPIGRFEENEKPKGGETGNTNKAITMRIEGVDTTFNRIKIYALYSFAGEGIDAVELINEQNVVEPVIEITHFEFNRGTQFTYEQLLNNNNGFKYARHLESSNGRLFAADTSNDIPDLRAWDTVIKQYNNVGGTYAGNYNTDPDTFKYLSESYNNASGAESSLIFGGQSESFAAGNGVRLVYKIKEYPIEDFLSGLPTIIAYTGQYDASFPYTKGQIVIYQGQLWESQTTGNTGNTPEIGVFWKPYDVRLSSFDVGSQFNVGYNQKSDLIEYLEYFPEPKSPLYHGNKAANFTSPHFHHRMAGYTPGETYRIGILPRDLQGNPLLTKYIGDIRIPEYDDIYRDFNLQTNTHNYEGFDPNGEVSDFRPFVTKTLYGIKTVFARVVYLNIEVQIPKNIQEQISGYEIVRSKIRTDDKRAIVHGIMNQVSKYSNNALPSQYDLTNYGQGVEGAMNNTFGVSPEQNRYRNPSDVRGYVAKGIYTLDSPDAMTGRVSLNDLYNLEVAYVQDLRFEQTQATLNHFNTNSNEDIPAYLETFSAGPTTPLLGNAKRNLPLDLFRAVNVGSNELVPKQIIRSAQSDFRNGQMLNALPSSAGTTNIVAGQNYFNGNPTVLFRLQNDSDEISVTAPVMVKSLLNIRRKSVQPYGGRTEFSVVNTQWISTGHYTKVESHKYMHYVGGGDHYSCMFSYGKAFAQSSWDRPRGNQEVYGVSVPSISNINVNFIHGARVFDNDFDWQVSEPLLLNDAFAKENLFRVYITDDDRVPVINHQPYTIAVSPQKINGALVDQWLKFPVFDFYEMPNQYGFITDLISVNDKLYVVQERGIAILAIDPNALIKGEQTDILIGNGSGRVIADHQYICNYGTSYKSSIVKFPDGFIFLDNINQCYVLIYRNQYKLLSDETMNSSRFRALFSQNPAMQDTPLSGNGFAGYYDPIYKEIITSIIQ